MNTAAAMGSGIAQTRPFATPTPTQLASCPRSSLAARSPCMCSSSRTPHQLQEQQQTPQQPAVGPSRRALLAAPLGAAWLLQPCSPAAAFTPPPAGLRVHEDKLDGYTFLYPEDWTPVTTSGNDVFFRNPFNPEENVFVDISSPSSSKFESVADLGSPQEAAQRTLDQYLEEFMSTRIGIRKEAEVVSAVERTGADGLQYYDIQTRVKSFASRNQLAVTQVEVDEGIELEWDRRYLAVLGVANQRLYQLRAQAANAAFERSTDKFTSIAQSFRLKEV